PLTTSLIDDAEPLRFRITSRDKLQKDSDILIAHIRSIDNSRFIEKVAILSETEMLEIKEFLDEVLLNY
ncbi:MAG TPA: type II toxin-antitoxin system PemK/MazF family toxin, partial [Arcobacter sp.]|nr:type II toxin-antitoxin system PemK/MazF family toxin [Arcobacter sp.]